MAVDTRDERAAAAHHWLPDPDGTVGTLDRRQAAREYPLLSLPALPTPADPHALTCSYRDRGHTCTRSDRGHTATARESC
jgi:hypothetical protein